MIDRTPLILAALDDLLRERVESHPNDADLLALADGVALAVDHGEAARLWPVTGHDQSDADVILDVLLDDVTNGREAHLRATTAVARRLADVAASLLIRGDAMRREAEALWGAASRLLDSESAFAVAYDNVKRELLAAEASASAGDRYIDNERESLLASANDLLAWRAWANGLAGAAGTDDEMRDHVGARVHDFNVEVANQERLIADMTKMMADKDAIIAKQREDLAKVHARCDDLVRETSEALGARNEAQHRAKAFEDALLQRSAQEIREALGE